MLHAEDVASIIVARSPGAVDRMKLLTLLYYVQAWHLAITDECAYPEKTKAWVEGPVVPQVWHAFKDHETRRPENQNLSTLEVSHTLSSVIDAVLATYGHMTGKQLSQLTHDELPWAEVRGGRPASEPCSDEVSVETMARFYRTHNLLAGQTAADIAVGGFVIQEASEEAFDVVEKARADRQHLVALVAEHALHRPCPRCGVPVGQRCENLTERRRRVAVPTASPHEERLPSWGGPGEMAIADAFLETLDAGAFPEQMPWDDSERYEPPADFLSFSQRATA